MYEYSKIGTPPRARASQVFISCYMHGAADRRVGRSRAAPHAAGLRPGRGAARGAWTDGEEAATN